MSGLKNVVIAQSGGPSPVINNSLREVIETCKMFPEKFGGIYAGYHGIEGVLKEELLDLSDQKEEEISFLRTTPGCVGFLFMLSPNEGQYNQQHMRDHLQI